MQILRCGLFAAAMVLAAVSILLAEGLRKTEPAQAGFSAERLQRIHTVLEESVGRKEFAGINVAIVRHGKLAYAGSFGFRGLEEKKPMQPDTIFRLFSMTKPITSAAVMMLYEESKFLLDDPYDQFLRDGWPDQIRTKRDRGGGARIPLSRAYRHSEPWS